MLMINLEMDSFVFNQQNSHGIMDDVKNQGYAAVSSPSSSSSEVFSGVSSDEEEDSDLFEVNSSSSTSSSPTSDSSTLSSGQLAPQSSGPLQDMSSLLQDLPFKRGLSKHYNGKSQSFTSLANVTSLEDLAKPENPYNKKLKSCKSYGGFLDSHGNGSSNNLAAARSNSSSRLISRSKGSRGSCSSLCVKRNSSFLGNNKPPPIPPPHRSPSASNFNSQPSLFALGV